MIPQESLKNLCNLEIFLSHPWCSSSLHIKKACCVTTELFRHIAINGVLYYASGLISCIFFMAAVRQIESSPQEIPSSVTAAVSIPSCNREGTCRVPYLTCTITMCYFNSKPIESLLKDDILLLWTTFDFRGA